MNILCAATHGTASGCVKASQNEAALLARDWLLSYMMEHEAAAELEEGAGSVWYLT